AGASAKDIYGNIEETRKLAPEKPFLISVIGHDEIENQVNEISGIGTPVFKSSEMAVKTLAAMWKYKKWLERSI
ncbi:hypothetical protein KKA14_17940, partial [bacterium]|nr:hypothetical protein [bacterium]